MTEKRMLIVPEELVRKIDENRGDLSQGEFVTFLIENSFREQAKTSAGVSSEELKSLKEEVKKLLEKVESKANKEDFKGFQQETKKLLKSFVDFFIGYGLELNKKTGDTGLDELSKMIDSIEKSQPQTDEDSGREVKIKWK